MLYFGVWGTSHDSIRRCSACLHQLAFACVKQDLKSVSRYFSLRVGCALRLRGSACVKRAQDALEYEV